MAEIIKKEKIKVPNGTMAKLCKKAGISIYELSKRTYVPEATLHMFNKGKRTMAWKTWILVCDYLDTIKKLK